MEPAGSFFNFEMPDGLVECAISGLTTFMMYFAHMMMPLFSFVLVLLVYWWDSTLGCLHFAKAAQLTKEQMKAQRVKSFTKGPWCLGSQGPMGIPVQATLGPPPPPEGPLGPKIVLLGREFWATSSDDGRGSGGFLLPPPFGVSPREGGRAGVTPPPPPSAEANPPPPPPHKSVLESARTRSVHVDALVACLRDSRPPE